jgi:glycine/D-amino acid oxidase-like deaminating enzyme
MVASAAPSAPYLPKVLVAPQREIRTTVCLRPFRASGFRVAAEKLGDKLCVHNYGHGGAGITLSWGTAQLAIEQLLEAQDTQIAVLGCGVVGLATARLLQQIGKQVTIYAKALPPETTSNSAGGFLMPVTVYDQERLTPEFRQQFVRAAKFSYTYFQQFAGEDYALHWFTTYILRDEPINEADLFGANGPLREIFADAHDLQPHEHRFPAQYVRQFKAMLIEPHTYIRSLIRDFRFAGGRIFVREFSDIAQITAVPERVVVNCTGLGAGKLFSDSDVMPIKGQLTYLLPQPEVNYIVVADELYMFPRHDGIVLGGTHARGDWTLEPDQEAKARVLAGQAKLFSRL